MKGGWGQFHKRIPFKRDFIIFLKKVKGVNFTTKKNQKTSKNCSKIPYGGSDTFPNKIQKIQIPVKILIFVGPTLQLVENIKPMRQLLCTFFSCSTLGIHMIYNIYKFHEK